VSALAEPTELAPLAAGQPAPADGGQAPPWPRPHRSRAIWLLGGLIVAIACVITFYATGGLNLETMTFTEMALTLGCGAIIAWALLLAPARGRRLEAAWPMALLLALTALTAISVAWSVAPDESWQDAGRMLAYSAVFGASIALVRMAPARWPAVLGGLAIASVIVCGYALLTKIFPGPLGPPDAYARLEEPFGYWNAVGLTAAMGAICCMWLGARRDGHALVRALAYPALGLLLLTVILAYSRGSLAALATGLALWFVLVPLRLRGAVLLIVAAVAAVAVGAWDFATHSLSAESVPLAQRTSGGHQLGVLVVVMLILLLCVGVAVGFLTGRRAPSARARRRAGATLLAVMALCVLLFAGALAHSQRGFTGSISHAFNALTDPNAKPPPNTPGRLTAVASVRARYWKEALQIFAAHPALGAGAGGYRTARLRYRTETLEVRHAHGFLVQTLADLGIVGLLIALGLLLTWMGAAGRATHPLNRRWAPWGQWLKMRSGGSPGWLRRPGPYPPERIGMLSMLCLVVVFGMHSLIDWTWYVPGNACVALLCAGWLAGRGELRREPAVEAAHPEGEAPAGPGDRPRPSRMRVALACAAIIAALLAVWTQWQPQRSEEARAQALTLLAHDPAAAVRAAETAVSRDPLSIEALFAASSIEQAAGKPALARATLQRAVRLQPSNPQTWLTLGRYDLTHAPRSALAELQAAIYLNPESIAPELLASHQREAVEIYNDYVEAVRASQAPVTSASGTPPRAGALSSPAARRRAARRLRRIRSRKAAG
jgi:O-antigen ligase